MEDVRNQRIVVELHSKLARLERRPKMQNQGVNKKLLLVSDRIRLQIHRMKIDPRKFRPFVKSRPNFTVCVCECEQVADFSFPRVLANREHGGEKTDNDARRLQ